MKSFNVVLTLPKETVGNGVAGRGEPFSAPAAKDVGSALAWLNAKLPDLKVHLIGGEIDLYQETAEPLFRFRELALHAELSPAQVKLDLSCQSDLVEAFSLKGWLDPDRFTGEVQAGLTGFHPHKLARCFRLPECTGCASRDGIRESRLRRDPGRASGKGGVGGFAAQAH